jgi:hypothetical protein
MSSRALWPSGVLGGMRIAPIFLVSLDHFHGNQQSSPLGRLNRGEVGF